MCRSPCVKFDTTHHAQHRLVLPVLLCALKKPFCSCEPEAGSHRDRRMISVFACGMRGWKPAHTADATWMWVGYKSNRIQLRSGVEGPPDALMSKSHSAIKGDVGSLNF